MLKIHTVETYKQATLMVAAASETEPLCGFSFMDKNRDMVSVIFANETQLSDFLQMVGKALELRDGGVSSYQLSGEQPLPLKL